MESKTYFRFLLLIAGILVSDFASSQTWTGGAYNSTVLTWRLGNVVIGGSSILGSYTGTQKLLQIQGQTNSWLQLRPTASTKWLEIGAGDDSGSAVIYAHSTPLTLWADGTRMAVDNLTGNVRIGGTSFLGTYGATEKVVQVQGQTNSWLNLRPTGSSKWFEIGVGEASGSAVLYAHSTPLTFWADGTRMTIDNISGNVGIGTLLTSNPNNYKLAVNGLIGAKEVKVENTSTTWPDYVFNDEYKLSPLSEVEDFIKENKHLPEIPSATEIKEHGHALGEMNALLLKKVEELTLYLINIKKRSG